MDKLGRGWHIGRMTEQGINDVAEALSVELAGMGHHVTQAQAEVLARAAITALDHYRQGKVDALVEAAREHYIGARSFEESPEPRRHERPAAPAAGSTEPGVPIAEEVIRQG